MRRLALKMEQNSKIDIAVFASSKGAEVYSIARTLKSARPDLTVKIKAVDILPDAVKVAEQGCYSLRGCDEWGAPFGRIYEDEIREMFDRNGDVLSVKPWIREGISWHCADAGDPVFVSELGPQDIVVQIGFCATCVRPAPRRSCATSVGFSSLEDICLLPESTSTCESKWQQT